MSMRGQLGDQVAWDQELAAMSPEEKFSRGLINQTELLKELFGTTSGINPAELAEYSDLLDEARNWGPGKGLSDEKNNRRARGSAIFIDSGIPQEQLDQIRSYASTPEYQQALAAAEQAKQDASPGRPAQRAMRMQRAYDETLAAELANAGLRPVDELIAEVFPEQTKILTPSRINPDDPQFKDEYTYITDPNDPNFGQVQWVRDLEFDTDGIGWSTIREVGLTAASLIPSPIQPLAQAVQIGRSATNVIEGDASVGDFIGLLSAGAGQALSSAQGALGAAEAAGDAAAAADAAQNIERITQAADAIGTVQQVDNLVQAVEDENWLGALTSVGGVTGQFDLPEQVGGRLADSLDALTGGYLSENNLLTDAASALTSGVQSAAAGEDFEGILQDIASTYVREGGGVGGQLEDWVEDNAQGVVDFARDVADPIYEAGSTVLAGVDDFVSENLPDVDLGGAGLEGLIDPLVAAGSAIDDALIQPVVETAPVVEDIIREPIVTAGDIAQEAIIDPAVAAGDVFQESVIDPAVQAAAAVEDIVSEAIPSTQMPEVPDVNLPDVNLPDVNLPDVNAPDLDFGRLAGLLGLFGIPQGGGMMAAPQAPQVNNDPTSIDYFYDFSSIFANPEQERSFVDPYGLRTGPAQDPLQDIMRGIV